MAVQRYHDRFFRFTGIAMSMVYAVWIIIGLTNDFPYWLTFAGPLPIYLVVFIIYFIVIYTRSPEKYTEEAKHKELEKDYQDLNL